MEASRRHTTRHVPSGFAPRLAAHPESWSVQLRWFAIAALVGFAVPLIGASVLELQHDVYLGIHFASVLALTWAYTTATGADWGAILARNWKASVLLGLVFGFVLVRNVLAQDATAHPHGGYYWFELVWRGALYGSVDALLLTVLPCTMVHRALGGQLPTWGKRLAYFGASAALIVAITAAYHLGYPQYRQDGVRQPETGNAIISLPMLLTANPIGSVGSHAAMHVSATAHIYETDVRLPPSVEAE